VLGPDFANDDVVVDVTGRTLSIVAAYGAEIGAYGTQVKQNSLSFSLLLSLCFELFYCHYRSYDTRRGKALFRSAFAIFV